MFTDAFVAIPYVDRAQEDSSAEHAALANTASNTNSTTLSQRPHVWGSVTSPASSSVAAAAFPPRPISPSLNAGLISSYFMARQQKQLSQLHPPSQQSQQQTIPQPATQSKASSNFTSQK